LHKSGEVVKKGAARGCPSQTVAFSISSSTSRSEVLRDNAGRQPEECVHQPGRKFAKALHTWQTDWVNLLGCIAIPPKGANFRLHILSKTGTNAGLSVHGIVERRLEMSLEIETDKQEGHVLVPCTLWKGSQKSGTSRRGYLRTLGFTVWTCRALNGGCV